MLNKILIELKNLRVTTIGPIIFEEVRLLYNKKMNCLKKN